MIGLISILVVVPLTCLFVFVPLWMVGQYDASIWVLIVPASLYLLILLGGGSGAVALSFSVNGGQYA